MQFARTLTLGTLALAANACFAGPCDHVAPREADLDAVGVDLVRLDVGAGSLTIRGVEGASRASFRGQACASDDDLLERIELDVRRQDEVIVAIAKMPKITGRKQARLDLEVELPAGARVDVDDGSGEIVLSGLSGAKIEDGSGSITIQKLSGEIEIEDGSGDIELRRVRGSVRVDDGSGDVSIEEITGEVRIDDDGSGHVAISRVEGDVTIGSDGSGDLEIEDVTGDVRIRDDGSGDISVRRVGGDLTVDDDGSGSIRYEEITGRTDVPKD